jgi:hypothetical protein
MEFGHAAWPQKVSLEVHKVLLVVRRGIACHLGLWIVPPHNVQSRSSAQIPGARPHGQVSTRRTEISRNLPIHNFTGKGDNLTDP